MRNIYLDAMCTSANTCRFSPVHKEPYTLYCLIIFFKYVHIFASYTGAVYGRQHSHCCSNPGKFTLGRLGSNIPPSIQLGLRDVSTSS